MFFTRILSLLQVVYDSLFDFFIYRRKIPKSMAQLAQIFYLENQVNFDLIFFIYRRKTRKSMAQLAQIFYLENQVKSYLILHI